MHEHGVDVREMDARLDNGRTHQHIDVPLHEPQQHVFELAAQASAVAVKQGASAGVAYDAGVAVFTMTRGGAMVEASVGGQTFKYEPKEQG